MLAAQKPLAAFGKRLPPPFARRDGLPPSRADSDAFRELVLARIVREAFRLSENAALPRTKAAFEALSALGTPRLDAAFSAVTRAVAGVRSELDSTWRALERASQQPSGTAAARDIQAQLEHLLASDLVANVELERLEHVPRYLRAAQTRLARAITDPRKDADKHAPFAPVWAAFLAKQPGARDRKAALALRWAFEELRVAIFAPELKPATPVSVASLSLLVSSLR
jgi:ATP-dependent helicase HrpA